MRTAAWTRQAGASPSASRKRVKLGATCTVIVHQRESSPGPRHGRMARESGAYLPVSARTRGRARFLQTGTTGAPVGAFRNRSHSGP